MCAAQHLQSRHANTSKTVSDKTAVTQQEALARPPPLAFSSSREQFIHPFPLGAYPALRVAGGCELS